MSLYFIHFAKLVIILGEQINPTIECRGRMDGERWDSDWQSIQDYYIIHLGRQYDKILILISNDRASLIHCALLYLLHSV